MYKLPCSCTSCLYKHVYKSCLLRCTHVQLCRAFLACTEHVTKSKKVFHVTSQATKHVRFERPRERSVAHDTHTLTHIPHTYPAANIDVWGKIAVRSLAADSHSADSPIRPLDLSFFSQCVSCQHPTLLLAARRGECPTWTSDLTLQLHSLRAGSRRTNGARPTGTPVATHIF